MKSSGRDMRGSLVALKTDEIQGLCSLAPGLEESPPCLAGFSVTSYPFPVSTLSLSSLTLLTEAPDTLDSFQNRINAAVIVKKKY